jgi:hypothetical protein
MDAAGVITRVNTARRDSRRSAEIPMLVVAPRVILKIQIWMGRQVIVLAEVLIPTEAGV